MSKVGAKIEISVYARIHICLLGLSGNGYRRNGGVGFSVHSPSFTIEFIRSQHSDISILYNFGFLSHEIIRLNSRIQRITVDLGLSAGITAVKCSEFPRHNGFGSGTAIALACVEALLVANGHSVDKALLQRLSGRGGVSGIGINTYFDGGLIFDAGRKECDFPFLPSGAIDSDFELPLPLVSSPMPLWNIGILTLPNVQPLTAQAERQLFESVCPLPLSDVHEAVYHAVFGVVSSAMTHDFSMFCKAINALQKCTWKRSEIAAYGESISDAIDKLHGLGCDAVGLTSIGPSLYFFAKDFDHICSKIRKFVPDGRLIQTQTRNVGREIVIV